MTSRQDDKNINENDETRFVTAQEFLSSVTGEYDPVLIWKSLKYGKGKVYMRGPKPFDEMEDWLRKHNEEYRTEIFFSLRSYRYIKEGYKVGGKGRLKKWLKRPPQAYVIDMDCDTSDLTTVNAILMSTLRKAEEIGIFPTYIIYSRNGFHLYWVMEGGIRTSHRTEPEESWKEVQKRLIEIFGSDNRIHSQTQDLRLPTTFHWKGNPTPRLVLARATGSMKLTRDAFLRAIEIPTDEEAFDIGWGFATYPIQTLIKEKRAPVETKLPTVDPIRSVSPTPIQEQLPLQIKQSFPSFYQEVRDALMKAKSRIGLLGNYLGIEEGVCLCPFHNDSRPSGHLFKNDKDRKSGYTPSFFTCHSKNCSVKTLDLADAVNLKEGLQGRDLVLKILNLSGELELVGRIKSFPINPRSNRPSRTAHLDQNLSLKLFSFFPFGSKDNYGTWRWIEPFIRDFFSLARAKIANPDGTFPASLREISRGKDPKQYAHKLYLLRLIGLLEAADIPDTCKASQQAFKVKTGAKNDTSWHRIPRWTEEGLRKAFELLNEAYKAGINTRSCTRAQIRRTFGPEAEARVFRGQTTVRRGFIGTMEELEEYNQWLRTLTDEELEAHVIGITGRPEKELTSYSRAS